MSISIHTLTSSLHHEAAIKKETADFFADFNFQFSCHEEDFAHYGEADLCLIYVRTGGTEGLLKAQLPSLLHQSDRPFYLLTSGKSNSLAASMEILSYLQQNNLKGEIIHGDKAYVNSRIHMLHRVESARKSLQGKRLGVIGAPSDWLIASMASSVALKSKLGIELVNIDIQEVLAALETVQQQPAECEALAQLAPCTALKDAVPGAISLYFALKQVVNRHRLNGFTIRCFDLLGAVHNTGCYALARLNAEGIIAGCEGDVPTMITMTIVHELTGVSGFQANPSRINPITGEILLAHCTIPLNMVNRYELDTHFESGIGIGIRGQMAEGPVTICKASGDLSRFVALEATLKKSLSEPNLCRTQQLLQLLNPNQADYFLKSPIGNHHVIAPTHISPLFTALLQ
ncbi:MAG: hypothetical protein ACI30R_10475 [Sodaliphilus sp.]